MAKAKPLSANIAHIRHSRPDSGLALQVKVLKIFEAFPSSLGGESKFRGSDITKNVLI